MGDLKRDPAGRPIFLDLPQRALLMEAASSDLFEALKRCTLQQLQSLQPTGPFVRLIDALIYVRTLLGEDPPTAQEIEDLTRRRLLYRS